MLRELHRAFHFIASGFGFRVVVNFFTPSYTEFILKWIVLRELHRAFHLFEFSNRTVCLAVKHFLIICLRPKIDLHRLIPTKFGMNYGFFFLF